MVGEHPVILALMDYYRPGYKAGGPITTVAHMVEQLGPGFQFRIVTRDRDLGDSHPFSGIRPDAWTTHGAAEVLYLPPARCGLRGVRRVLRDVPHDLLYLNSLFSPVFSAGPLLLRRLGLVPRRPTVLAPRGELARGALRWGWWKKRAFLHAFRGLSLDCGIIWQASSESEAHDIRRRNGARSLVRVAPDLRPQSVSAGAVRTLPKQAGRLRVVFLSRISPVKNLIGALEMLAGVDSPVEFNVYGPVDDAQCWRQCQSAIQNLPANVRVSHRGAAKPDLVPSILADHDLLLLPTLGENFGHVILEALSAGCPVLISDRTPWRQLERHGVGWDLPLGSTASFRTALNRVAAMDDKEHRALRERAREFAACASQQPEVVRQNERLFAEALALRGQRPLQATRRSLDSAAGGGASRAVVSEL